MFKKLYCYIKMEQGNAMVLVVFITLCCTIIMGTVMYITFTQVGYSQAYKKASNIDVLAMSGAEKAVSILNDKINEKLEGWVKEVSSELLSTDIDNKVSYQLEADSRDEYDGYYHLKDTIGTDKLFVNQLSKKISDNIESTITRSVLNYFVEVEGIKYRIDVAIDLTHIKDNDPLTRKGFVTSTATRLDSGNKSAVNAEFNLLDRAVATNKEILYEQYGWKTALPAQPVVPEKFSNAIVSLGDLVITGERSKLTVIGAMDLTSKTILGNVTVKGYKPVEYEHNQGDDFGGIYVMDGGTLELINGASAYTQANIHTKRTFGGNNKPSKIMIDGNAVADSISIEDNYYFNNGGIDVSSFNKVINYAPYDEDTMTKDNSIIINKDAYAYNDINISRYTKDSNIKIVNNAFGIKADDINPNNASAIFNQGLGSSLIDIGHAAFVNGKVFVTYKDEFKRLEESIGVPYDAVYDKIEEYSSKPEGFNYHYINYFKGLVTNSVVKKVVRNDSVKISTFTSNPTDFYGYITGYASANGLYYKIPDTDGTTVAHTISPKMWEVANNADTSKLFFKQIGSDSFFSNYKEKEVLIKEQIKDISKIPEVLGHETTYNWNDTDINTIWEKGIKGYMDEQFKLFNENFIDDSVMMTQHTADIYNPIEIITNAVGEQTIDVSKFKTASQYVPAIIIDTRRNGILKLTGNIFNGYIYTKGKIVLDHDITINGAIVAGNHKSGSTNTNIAELEKGDYAGILVKNGADVKINYDISQLLKVRTDDFPLRRKVYDYLKLTDYNTHNPTRVDHIAKILDKLKIETNSAISVDVNDAYKIKYKINKLKYVKE